MNEKFFIIFLLVLVSCTNKTTGVSEDEENDLDHHVENAVAIEAQAEKLEIQMAIDTSSMFVNNEKRKSNQGIVKHLLDQLRSLDIIPESFDQNLTSNLIDEWRLEDSIGVLILSVSTGVSYDEFLFTVDSNREMISRLQIGDADDRDLSIEYYEYTDYKIISKQEVLLSRHRIEGPEDNETETITDEYWRIQKGGQILERTKGN